MENTITACGKCGSSLGGAMKFCPACGKRVMVKSSALYPTVVVSGLVLFGLALGLQTLVRGNRPAPSPARGALPEHAEAEQVSDDPHILAMRKELDKSPEDLTKLRMYAGMLADKLRANPSAPPALVFEEIDVLGKILQAEPNDPTALVMMADVSFDQRAFTKALDFYERYLKLDPNDLGARSRYASTLTFLGRYNDSIAELTKVLAQDPKNFPAMAYLAITYAQSGDVSKAKELGNTALQIAPSEDARARFSAFVTALDTAPSEKPVATAPQQSAAASSATGIDGFIASIKANPIAGPKFVRYDDAKDGTLKLVFANFPMSQMPPFAKEKFFSGIKAAAKQNGLEKISSVLFIDHATGAEMEKLPL
jgi:cytochrome c-type biogenesis protein CcmH/NrfG